MPGNAEAYERIVRSLLLSKLVAGPSVQLNAFHLKRYTGKSGQEHEVDVSFEIELAGVKFLVVVECKDYGRTVGVDDVMTFVYRVRDIAAHKGLLVTTRGFQAGAVTVAKAEGIGLLVAANGVIDVYLGAQYTLYELWIGNLELHIASGADSVTVVGKRYIQGNCHSRVISFHAPMEHQYDHSGLALLTPEEEPQLVSAPDSGRRLFFGTYGRVISSRKDSDGVVLC